jgi:DNA polymerase-3 subunit delta
LEHCAAGHLAVSAPSDSAGILDKAIENGFPRRHHLIITTDIVDRRRSLFSRIRENGLVVDCSVPRGERQADKKVQEAVLSEHMQTLLGPRNKTLSRPAFLALCETTGFDPGVFSNNLEILVDYVGARPEITVEDVAAVLTRTKKDPLYELTNAVSDRDWEKSFFFLKSLLAGDIHGLQALAAVINQVRRLLVAKDFVEGPLGRVWHSGCSYAEFQRNVMPAVVQHDRELLTRIEGWESGLTDEPPEGKRRKRSRVSSDLMLAKNPANAFPVYQLLKKSDRFARNDLLRALETLNEADFKLKSSALPARLVLEHVVLQICSPAA